MPALYVFEQGAVLRKEAERLYVEKDGQRLQDCPLEQLEAILIFGAVGLSTPLIAELLERQIETAFFTLSGRLRGQLTPALPRNSLLRMAQFEKARDPAACLIVSRWIVCAKIRNSAEVLKRFARDESPLASSAAADCERLINSAAACDTLDRLRGIEGAAANAYWNAFASLLKHGISFPGRRFHPSPDPVNAALSLGYSLLAAEIQSLLDGIGFDPYIGFLHSVEYGRASLALDLLEEYRAPVVDRLVLYLFNNRILKPDDFDCASDGARLKPEPRKRFFREYESRLNRAFHDRDYPGQQTFRSVFRLQAHRLAKWITAGVPYEPYSYEADSK